MIHKPLVIVGGGPIGLIAALRFVKNGYTVTILDRDVNFKAQDGRVLALSYASCQLLEELGLWDIKTATRINQVHISHSGLGVSIIKASSVKIPELGFTISYAVLCEKLKAEVIKYPQIELVNALVKEVVPGPNFATVSYAKSNDSLLEYLTADLVVLAEGGQIQLNTISYREYDYQQTAIIARIQTPHNHMAFERFDASGSLVLLPYLDHYVLIWVRDNADNKDKRLTNHKVLEGELKLLSFMKRFGNFCVGESVHSFPLKLQVADNRVYNQVVLVGNSAQIVHPISAQGLNLGIRDIEDLLQVLDETSHNYSRLSLYNKKRMMDAGFVTQFTHILARLLEYPSIRHFRGLGLISFSNIRLLQNKIARALIFGN